MTGKLARPRPPQKNEGKSSLEEAKAFPSKAEALFCEAEMFLPCEDTT